jgi:hypothetical protein
MKHHSCDLCKKQINDENKAVVEGLYRIQMMDKDKPFDELEIRTKACPQGHEMGARHLIYTNFDLDICKSCLIAIIEESTPHKPEME